MRPKLIIGTVVVFFLACLLALPESYTRSVHDMVTRVFTPFFNVTTSVKMRVGRIREDFKSLDLLAQENRSMKRELAKLRTENDRLREMARENDKLKEILGFVQNSSFELVPARVIARDASNWWQGLLLDKGWRDKRAIESNMPVITEAGLVGKITTVAENQCRMVLIIDENCKVSSVIQDSREQGIVMGVREASEATPVLKMTFISRKADLVPGQLIVTSGLGGVFPPNIIIGSVVETRTANRAGALGLYREAFIKPSVDLSNLENVFIVVGRK